MRRGEIRLVNLDPVVGSEANKQRRAVVVSNDQAEIDQTLKLQLGLG